jgi:hypothetical protein
MDHAGNFGMVTFGQLMQRNPKRQAHHALTSDELDELIVIIRRVKDDNDLHLSRLNGNNRVHPFALGVKASLANERADHLVDALGRWFGPKNETEVCFLAWFFARRRKNLSHVPLSGLDCALL